MKTKKPISRNAAIVEFSKDHHFALLLVWKIREGLKNSIEPSRINKYVIHFFDSDLILHLQEEEKLLYPRLPKHNKLRIQAETEHETIYRIIDDLRKKTNDKDLLERFADILEKHVRFEERELFNYLQQHVPEAELLTIESSLKSREHEPDTAWNDGFWKA